MCIFCKIANKEIPSNIVYEDDYVISFLDLSQATKGHTLVVPKNHVTNVLDSDIDTLHHVMDGIKNTTEVLKDKLNITSLNVLNNSGEGAGQTVMHMHFHLLPRYEDDDLTIEFKPHLLTDDIINTLKK